MNTSVNKTLATVLAGALTTIVVWLLKLTLDVNMPIEVQGAFTTVMAGVATYFTPNAGA